MTRIKFSCVGTHPLMSLVTQRLITQLKLQQVLLSNEPDFVVLGAVYAGDSLGPALMQLIFEVGNLNQDVPVLVLSSAVVYSDRTDLLAVSDHKTMSEDRGLVVRSVMDLKAAPTLYTLTAENLVVSAFKHALILRIFDVYGSGVVSTVDALLLQAIQGKPLSIPAPGYQTRTYLHVDDFVTAFDKLIPKFFKGGARGIYNIGSTEEVSFVRLADSIWQLTNEVTEASPLTAVPQKGQQLWWKKPDIARLQALLKWSPVITLRKGLWRMIHESKQSCTKVQKCGNLPLEDAQ